MKKVLALLFVLAVAVSFAACGGGSTTPPVNSDPDVMTFAQYNTAEIDSQVIIVTNVQAKQGIWEGKTTVYAQSEDGAYFIYNMPVTEEEYAKLVPGAKIKVTGTKSEWSGEIEIIDATFEVLEGSYIATAKDVTALLGSDNLVAEQNKLVSFKGLKVVAAAEGSDAAFLYKWNGSGQEGDDLYFNASNGTDTFTFTVESDLCGADTEVYAAVKALKIDDTIDMEGFLYWYNGMNPHITSVTVIPAQ